MLFLKNLKHGEFIINFVEVYNFLFFNLFRWQSSTSKSIRSMTKQKSIEFGEKSRSWPNSTTRTSSMSVKVRLSPLEWEVTIMHTHPPLKNNFESWKHDIEIMMLSVIAIVNEPYWICFSKVIIYSKQVLIHW